MTMYPPRGRHSGVAVVVFPGGGYQFLAMDLEGTEICDWLTSRGMTCVLLKYRVPDSGPTMKDGRTFYPPVQTAVQDAQRTLGLVRERAAEWRVDPHKVGVIGFSAGGHLAAAVSTRFARRTYVPVDAADELSCRPDFAIVIYPGHLWTPGTLARLRHDIQVPADTPPTFLLHAEDDPVDPVDHSLTYYLALKKAGVPAEMHLYATGGHAFGLRATHEPIGSPLSQSSPLGTSTASTGADAGRNVVRDHWDHGEVIRPVSAGAVNALTDLLAQACPHFPGNGECPHYRRATFDISRSRSLSSDCTSSSSSA